MAILVILLGAKAFTNDGLPVNKKLRIHGSRAKLVGLFCFAVSALLMADGLFSTTMVVSRLSEYWRQEDTRSLSTHEDEAFRLTPAYKWVKCTTKNQLAEISFPGQFEYRSIEIPLASTVHRYVLSRTEGNATFSFAHTHFKDTDFMPKTLEESAEAFIANFLAMDINGTKPRITKETATRIGNFDAVDLEFSIGNSVSLNRIAFMNGETFKASVVIDRNKRQAPDVSEFFRTFLLHQKPDEQTESR